MIKEREGSGQTSKKKNFAGVNQRGGKGAARGRGEGRETVESGATSERHGNGEGGTMAVTE